MAEPGLAGFPQALIFVVSGFAILAFSLKVNNQSLLSWFVQRRMNTFASLQSEARLPTVVELEERGIWTRTDVLQTLRYWKSVASIEENRNGIAFYGERGRHLLTVPTRAFGTKAEASGFLSNATYLWKSGQSYVPYASSFLDQSAPQYSYSFGEKEVEIEAKARQARFAEAMSKLKEAQSTQRRSSLIIVPVCLTILIFDILPGHHWWTPSIGAVVGILSVQIMQIFRPTLSARKVATPRPARTNRFFLKFMQSKFGDYTISAGTQGLDVFGQRSFRQFSWLMFTDVRELDGYVLLLRRAYAAITIPPSAFATAEERESFLNEVRQNVNSQPQAAASADAS